MIGLALQMQYRLAQLAKRHGTLPPAVHTEPSLPPADGAQFLSGLASTTDVDLEKMKFRGWAFPLPSMTRQPMPPLLYRHTEPAGTIESLAYDARGNLQITCRVEHSLARRCGAFSVSATVEAYEIIDADKPTFHALITRAVIDEISLTPVPANPSALVMHRRPVSAAVEFYDLMKSRVAILQGMIGVIDMSLDMKGAQP